IRSVCPSPHTISRTRRSRCILRPAGDCMGGFYPVKWELSRSSQVFVPAARFIPERGAILMRRVASVILLCLLPRFAAVEADQPESRLRVAGIVLKWIRGDKEANYRRAESMIRTAAERKAKLVVTTE